MKHLIKNNFIRPFAICGNFIIKQFYIYIWRMHTTFDFHRLRHLILHMLFIKCFWSFHSGHYTICHYWSIVSHLIGSISCRHLEPITGCCAKTNQLAFSLYIFLAKNCSWLLFVCVIYCCCMPNLCTSILTLEEFILFICYILCLFDGWFVTCCHYQMREPKWNILILELYI